MGDIRLVNDAARRVAESLLQNGGGRVVYLRIPVPANAPSINDQLGLAAPEFQDVELSPVVFRKARAQAAGGRLTWELMISVVCLTGVVGTTGEADASTLFAEASGVLVDGNLMEIESVSSSDMDGSPYVHRVVVRDPAARVI